MIVFVADKGGGEGNSCFWYSNHSSHDKDGICSGYIHVWL